MMAMVTLILLPWQWQQSHPLINRYLVQPQHCTEIARILKNLQSTITPTAATIIMKILQ